MLTGMYGNGTGMKRELIRRGKAKDIYRRSDGCIVFVFTDRVTAFDGVKSGEYPQKGEICCRLSCFWFERLEKEGIKTHFRGCIPPNELVAEEVSIIPVEVIARNYLYGSLWRRYKRGEIDLSGFLHGDGSEAEPLTSTYVEFTTKFESVDRPIAEEEIISRAWMNRDEIEYIKEETLKIGSIMSSYLTQKGLILADYKLEYGRSREEGREGEIILADEVGTPDVCRFWDSEAYNSRGEVVSLDKDVFREAKGELSAVYREVYRRILASG